MFSPKKKTELQALQMFKGWKNVLTLHGNVKLEELIKIYTQTYLYIYEHIHTNRLDNKWFALTKQIRLGGASNLGTKLSVEMTSKRPEALPPHYQAKTQLLFKLLTLDVMIIICNLCLYSHRANPRRYGVTMAALQHTAYVHRRSFLSLAIPSLFRSVRNVK